MDVRAYLDGRLPEMTALLAELVGIDSGSSDEAGCERVAGRVAREIAEAGGRVRLLPAEGRGPVVRATVGEGRDPVLVLGHLDTVWPPGEAARRPFRVSGGFAYGPGAFDMKAGVVQIVFALRVLHDLGRASQRPAVVLLTSDEEIGSDASRRYIEADAAASACALVAEPSGPRGEAKTGRKGVAMYRLEAIGRAAHAGLDPERGIDAILELSHQVIRVHRLAAPAVGTTVNVGVVHGGTQRNVVPDRATADLETRFANRDEARRVDAALRSLSPAREGAELRVSGGINRWPLERTPAVAALYEHAGRLARDLGFDLGEIAVGGASDGNLTAAMGVPTLDGLGPPGADAHQPSERVEIAALPRRAALLARLLETL